MEKTLERSTYSVLCIGNSLTTHGLVRLKLWPSAHVETPEDRQRIEAEVAAIQAVQHPHLLPILEVHTDKQGVYLVSAPVQEGSLNTRLSQQVLKPLPFDEALTILSQIGQALQALHEHGITHGNLTPLAVYFIQPDHACLGECSLPSIQRCIPGYQPLLDENIPRCWYMAPEQFEGQFSASTDQYALGCLAYVLLTGHVPFAGSARATLLQKHQKEQPRALSVLNQEIPANVEAAVLQALAKTPAERHSSILAFLQALGVPSASSSVLAQTEQSEETSAIVNEQNASEEEKNAPAPGNAENATRSSEDEQASVESILVGAQAHSANAALAARSALAWADLATIKQPALEAARTNGAVVESPMLPSASVADSHAPSPIAPGISRVPKPPASKVSRARNLAVLTPMVALILVIVVVLGSWLAMGGGRAALSQLTTPGATKQAPGPTSTTGSLQPSPTGTINVIGVRYPTPTPVRLPSPTATTLPPGTTPPPGTGTVTPFGCLQQSNNGFLSVVFGYTNNNGSTVNIPIGSNNNLSPSFNGFQPTSFIPGTVADAFSVPLFGKSESWRLDGATVTVSGRSRLC